MFTTKALLLLTNDTLFQCAIFCLSNSVHQKTENTRNTEVMSKEITQERSKILSTRREYSQVTKLSNLWLTLLLFLSSNLKCYEKTWWFITNMLFLLQLIQCILFKVWQYLPIVQWSPSHPGLHSHFPSLHWPCSAQWEWQERSSHVGPTQPSSHWQIPLEQTPWLPHSIVQSSVGNSEKICLHILLKTEIVLSKRH